MKLPAGAGRGSGTPEGIALRWFVEGWVARAAQGTATPGERVGLRALAERARRADAHMDDLEEYRRATSPRTMLALLDALDAMGRDWLELSSDTAAWQDRATKAETALAAEGGHPVTITPEQRDDWRANALQGGTGWPHETLALLDALTATESARDTAERQVQAVRDVLAHHPYGGPDQEDAIRAALDGEAGR